MPKSDMSSTSGFELWYTGADWPLVIQNGKIRDNVSDDGMKDMGILLTIPKADFDRLFKAWASDDSPDPITLEDKYLPAPSMAAAPSSSRPIPAWPSLRTACCFC